MMTHAFKAADFGSLHTDVAIIGAGVSGLYSGWRLLTGKYDQQKTAPQNTPTVSLFEMSNRIGGRLFSVRQHPAIPNIVGELGGMRYMEHQKIAASLISKVFRLESENFPVSDDETIEKNIFYLRGQRFHESDFGKQDFVTRYGLPVDIQGKHPDKLFVDLVNDVLVNNGLGTGAKDRRVWDKIKNTLIYHKGPDKGVKLRDIGFWNLLKDQIGNEGYNYLSDAGAYYSNTINWNAAEAMPYLIGDFTGNPEFKTIKGGFDRIAEELSNAYVQNGGQLYVNSQLINFRYNTDTSISYKYELEIRNTTDNAEHKVYCNKIILAMPRRSLELINQDNFFYENGENLTLLNNIRSVLGEPSFKLLMVFEADSNGKPWWENRLGIKKGRSVTDLPMRQCYYFATDPQTKASLMLASYNDMRTVDFWKPLEPVDIGKQKFKAVQQKIAELERYQPKAMHNTSLQSLVEAGEQYPRALERLVYHSLDQLRELHGLPDIPEPDDTMFANWDDDPYGGGYHAWKARYDVDFTMKYMRKPKPAEQIYVCGEAYSDQQGWIEGAFCVAENLLQQEFGLAHPIEWLDKDYYLGR